MRTTIETPWGPSQHSKTYADGIVFHSTAGHGGFWLSPERFAAMPADLQAFQPYAAPNWYEEDCDWAIINLAFPEVFPAEHFKFAVDTLKHSHPELITPERQQRADAWTNANTDKWARGCEGTHGKGQWHVSIYNMADHTQTKEKVFPGIPVLPSVFTLEQFENAPIYKG